MRDRRAARTGRVAASIVAALALAGALVACSNDPLAEQYRAGDNKGFIAADGLRVVEIPVAERGEPVTLFRSPMLMKLDSGRTVNASMPLSRSHGSGLAKRRGSQSLTDSTMLRM